MQILGRDDPDPSGFARDVVIGGVPLRLFTGTQVISIDADPKSYPLLSPRPVLRNADFVSSGVLAAKAKAFDDGLFAAVELWTQRHGKSQAIEAMRQLHPMLSAAAELGGGAPIEPTEARAKAIRDGFLANDRQSRPIGFYTWSPELSHIFRQDRLLQSPFPNSMDAAVDTLVRTLHAQPVHRRTYERTARLAERLTNPLVRPDLRPWLRRLDAGAHYTPPPTLAWLPASDSHEARLMKRLVGDRPVPEEFSLFDELIQRVRRGDLTLEPDATSGWYDHQTWAAAALLTCDTNDEAPRLRCGADYRAHLEETFKAVLALTRETHIKGLKDIVCGAAGGRPVPRIILRPELAVEPLVTYYDRRAASYAFVRRLLADELGSQALKSLRRITADGPVDTSLDDELQVMERIFSGAAARARVDLGMAPTADDGDFRRFAADMESDPDLDQDLRAMVPAFYDIGRQRTKVWCFFGWSLRSARARFASMPSVRVLSDTPLHVEEGGSGFLLPMPEVAEVYTSRVLDRNEFRQLCKGCDTPAEIIQKIEALR